jgi:membrane-associated phospholipid phosphatase
VASVPSGVTSGVLRETRQPREHARRVSVGRPPWWLMLAALVVGGVVTADLLTRGPLERMDLQVSEVISDWGLRDSAAFPAVWVITQLGGRVTILVVLAGLVSYLAWRRHTWLPLVRVLLALALLTGVVYGIKHGTGRTAPAFPGSFFFHADGASFPSGHVANAVLMWGVARWQAVEYGLPERVQRTFWWLSIAGPVGTGLAMVSLDFHWLTDAVVGAAVGVLLLGVVHALDAVVLSRWVRARAGRQSA